MNDFVTVFEISADANGFRSEFLFRIAIGVVVTAASVRWMISLKKTGGAELITWCSPVLMVIWGLSWLGFHVPFFWNSENSTAALLRLYHAQEASVVEGVIRVKHKQPYSGHSKGDVIIIDGKEFEINFFRESPGYMTTISHGGALRPGVYARLTYHDGTILKVEIRKEPNQTLEPTRPVDARRARVVLAQL